MIALVLPCFKRSAKAIQSLFPEVAVLGEPVVELAKALRLERIESALSVGPHGNKACLVQYAQVP